MEGDLCVGDTVGVDVDKGLISICYIIWAIVMIRELVAFIGFVLCMSWTIQLEIPN